MPEKMRPLCTDLATNLKDLRQAFDLCSDIIFQEFNINAGKPLNAALVYTDGLTDLNSIREHMSAVIQETSSLPTTIQFSVENAVQHILNRLNTLTNVQTVNDMSEVIDAVTGASVTLFVDGFPTAIIINSPGGEGRDYRTGRRTDRGWTKGRVCREYENEYIVTQAPYKFQPSKKRNPQGRSMYQHKGRCYLY